VDTLAAHLTDWIKTEIDASGGAGAVFGLSGGVDSAVVAALALGAFPHQCLALIMPCHSDPQDAEDALLVAHHYGLATAHVDLAPVFDALIDQLGLTCSDLPENGLACANIKPRLRMTALYAFANQRDYRVLGTGNASELAVGYFTKYGDGGVDLLPLGSVTKTRVRQLAHALGVPQRIIDKPPSAGLWEGQTDEGEMGVTYAALDAYLDGVDDTAKAVVDPMRAASAHKRALPRIAPPLGG
jgi:NAD+ synthase